MNKAIFLDRDGTINVEKNYLHCIEDFEFIPGVIEALKIFQDLGYCLIIVTNQSGIARGYYTEEDFEHLTLWMVKQLEKQGIIITAVYYCPHHPRGSVKEFIQECDCRKPKTGMFQKAAREHAISLKDSYAVGDKIRDCSICIEGQCKGFLVGQNEKAEVLRQVQNGQVCNVRYAENLYQCAKQIEQENR